MTASVVQEPARPEKVAMTAPVVLTAGALQDAVVAAGFTPVGPPRFARFDPPFKPWFLRRNEVVQDVSLGSREGRGG